VGWYVKKALFLQVCEYSRRAAQNFDRRAAFALRPVAIAKAARNDRKVYLGQGGWPNAARVHTIRKWFAPVACGTQILPQLATLG
jgi:hypothetical protein